MYFQVSVASTRQPITASRGSSSPQKVEEEERRRRSRISEEDKIMDEWFAGVPEEEYYNADLQDFDSLFAVVSSFVPPPPRPPFMPDEDVPPTDGLTTCDLCSWALRNDRYTFSLDGTLGESNL